MMIYLALISIFTLAIGCTKQRNYIKELKHRIEVADAKSEQFRASLYEAKNRFDSIKSSIPPNIYRLTDSLKTIDESLTNNSVYESLVNDPYVSESYLRLSIPFAMRSLCNVVENLCKDGKLNPKHEVAKTYIDYRLSEIESLYTNK